MKKLPVFVAPLIVLAVLVPAHAADSPQQLWEKANNGDVTAQHQLGLHHQAPGTPDFDLNAARFWLEKAAGNGSAEAATDLALLLLDALKDDAERDVAIRNLELGAAAGLPRAQFHLATILAKGLLGLPGQPEQARSLMSRAAARNYPPALAALGVFYYNGVAGEQSVAEAERLFRAAADAGNALGQYHIAVLYLTDFYGEPDRTAARVWLARAVAQELPQALMIKGQLDLEDAQSAKERLAAFALIKRAAGYGLADAQILAGRLLSSGVLGTKDHTAAVDWYFLAAEQSHPEAQYRLGEHLLRGLGADQDAETAITWLELSAAQGHPGALQRLKSIVAAATQQKE